MQEWNDFYVATAGAAAALAGLLFVGISINLAKILEYPALPTRASLSLIMLIAILLFSMFLLIPQTTITEKGYFVTFFSVVLSIVIIKGDIKIYRLIDKEYKASALLNFAFDQVAILPYLIGGILLIAIGENGLYWIAAGFIISFIKAVSDEWVLLIEILR